LTNINNELLLVRSEKLRIEKHISLLKKDIDADMLDEKARKILYYAHPDEVIINISKNQ
jgi:cell division protein FtsB|tara:strand:- start:165 stop:341 length:177 start_codon:yes stop_codon:yes gene_type:complete